MAGALPNPLANILSKVEITPESILSVLSKTQTQTAPTLQGTRPRRCGCTSELSGCSCLGGGACREALGEALFHAGAAPALQLRDGAVEQGGQTLKASSGGGVERSCPPAAGSGARAAGLRAHPRLLWAGVGGDRWLSCQCRPSPPAGLSSFLQSVAGNPAPPSEAAPQSTSAGTAAPSAKGRGTPSSAQPFVPQSFGYSPNSSSSSAEVSSTSVNKGPPGHGSGLPSSSFKPPTNSLGFGGPSLDSSPSLRPAEHALSQSSDLAEPKPESEPPSPSLEMKIHNFLKGNPGFSGLHLSIPILSSLGASAPPEAHASSSDFSRGPTSTSLDSIDGTPVRDERSGTPTQDEMMDKPSSSNVDTLSLLSQIISPGSSTPSSTRSPLQGRDDGYPPELSNSVYRSFGLSREAPAGLELPSSLMESPQEKFYPDTSFQEDEDYRDFDYSGPPPSALVGLEKQPPKSILKGSKLSEAADYQPVLSSYSQRAAPGFGLKPPFAQSLRSLRDQSDGCDPLPSPSLYYGLRGSDSGSDASPTPSKSDEANHNSLAAPHPQKQYPDSPHLAPHRALFGPQNPLEKPATPSSISATSTIEFKNMLKNASRKPSEGGELFGQAAKGGEGQAGAEQPGSQEEHYRIETRVSSSCLELPDSTEEKGAPIETLGYRHAASRGMSGEPIRTVESVRALGKGSRGQGREASRGGWFELSGAGGTFDNGPSSASEGPGGSSSSGGSSSTPGFQAPYKDRGPPFQESSGSFRAGGTFSAAFDRHVRPPLGPPPLEHGSAFPRDQMGPPPAGPPKDLGGLFPRDRSVPAPRMPAPDHPRPFAKEASSPLGLPHGVPPPPSLDRGGVPFPTQPPPPLPGEHGGVPFSTPPPPGDLGLPFPAPPLAKDLGPAHQGTLKEHFNLPPGAPREPAGQPPHSLGAQALGRARESMGLAALNVSAAAPCHRDGTPPGGLGVRTPRPDFRPREAFLSRDPFNSLKRPRPPFARGPPFFTPKRPFFPPRY